MSEKTQPTAEDTKTDTAEALSVAELDQVEGGINPQPLPPIVRDRQ